jgi:hypothetical protein
MCSAINYGFWPGTPMAAAASLTVASRHAPAGGLPVVGVDHRQVESVCEIHRDEAERPANLVLIVELV